MKKKIKKKIAKEKKGLAMSFEPSKSWLKWYLRK